ncbi:hypothetical protein [Halocynthiibacter namhaensis]|uniref:hypothetical protein n=1 Tax=Halocynthiibacter namhaensis TaxID=1290553 RepID=UPI0012E09EEE|nr:hypothetical protein [Halocynthiibacter namhaensis]
MSSNKILTVSYGTFSCTLEGFEDSFTTMKLITEHFREIATQDPSFGTSEMRHDLDVLAAVAAGDDGAHPTDHIVAELGPDDHVTLRAQPLNVENTPTSAHDDDVPLEDAPVLAPADPILTENTSPAPLSELHQTDDDSDQETAQTEAPQEHSSDDNAIESVSALDKLERIRAVVARNTDALPPNEFSEDQHAAASATVSPPTPDIAAALEDMYSNDNGTPVSNENQSQSLDGASEEYVDIDASPSAPESADPKNPDMDTQTREVSAKPETRIQAIEAKTTPHEATQSTFEGPEASDAALTEQNDFAEKAKTAKPETVITTLESEEDAGDLAVPLILDQVVSDLPDTDEEEAATDGKTLPILLLTPNDAPSNKDAVVPSDNQAPEEQGFDDLAAATPDAGSLSEAAEADLIRELSQLSDDDMQESDPATLDRSHIDAAQDRLDHPLARDDGETPNEHDVSVSRLIDETNSQLENPDGQNRRSAISHLRAAVAATVADRRIRRVPNQDEDIEAYRADLASVVKPTPDQGRARRVKPSDQADRNDTRPPPLILVSEQRISTPSNDDAAHSDVPVSKASQVQPITPRRVQRSSIALDLASLEVVQDEALTSPWENFQSFADDKGAENCGEYLEAAAAWLTWIEGHAQFSRPQVMQLVASVMDEGSFSRKDSLRAFGNLVRAQVLVRASRGLFSISETSQFHP